MRKLISVLVLSIFLPLNVFASIKSEVIVENKDLYKGDSLIVTIRLNQDSHKDEINILQGIIEYDESLFEDIDEDSFKTMSNWADFEYNSETHSLVVINRYGTNLNEDIITFKIPLKKDVNPAATSIGFKDALVSNDKGDFALEDTDSNVNINVSLSELTGGKNPAPVYGKALENSQVRIYYILTIVVLELVIAVILLLIYNVAKKKYTDKTQRRNLIIGLCLVEIVSCSALFTHSVQKGDLNGDKKIDYEDAIILAKHLTNKEMLSNFKLENADMNKDGLITANDLAILVQLSTEKIPYIAKLTSTDNSTLSYEKGTVIDFRFLADVTDDELIEYVIIDGKKYKAEKVENTKNEYRVELEASTISKNYKYNVSEVILANGKTTKVNYETTVTVLKDKPSITTFSSREDVANSSVKVALTLTDPDDAMTSAVYELKDRSGKIVETGKLEKGKNSLTLKLSNAVAYKLYIKASYDRGGKQKENVGTVEDVYDLKIITDYRLQIGNLYFMQNDKVTDALDKNEEVYLYFTSSNVSGYAPKKVVIDGKQYTVSGVGNSKFRVKIPNANLTTEYINLSKVILSNGKTILVNESLGYRILKNKPTIITLSNEENLQNSSLNAKFDVLDADSTITKLVVKLYDEEGNFISEKEVSDKIYDIDLPTRSTSKYIIKVFADYERLPDSQYSYKDQLLYEKNVDALLRITVKDHTVDNRYPEKNSIVSLSYDIESNYKTPIKNIIIDNVVYNVSKTNLNRYEVEIPVGETSGVKSYNTQKVILENDLDFELDETIKIDVLKEYPVLDNLSIDENTEDRKVSIAFDIFDNEESLERGRIVLKDKLTEQIVAEKNIIQGKNEVEFILENAKKYDIQVLVDVTLDSEILEEESPNKKIDYPIYEVEYMIVNDYKLEITSIDTLKDNVSTEYFEKGDKVSIEFTETHLTDYYPIKVKVDGKEYDLNKKGDKYTFDIEGFTEAGVKTLKFESITLSNFAEIVIDCTKKIEVLKSTPKVTEVSIENGNITLEIEDIDSVLREKKAVILDSDGNEMYNSILTDATFTFDKKDKKVYTIKILGSYDLGSNTLTTDSNDYIDSILFEKTIDEDDTFFNIDDIESITIHKIDTDEVLEEIKEDDLLNIENLKIDLLLNDGTNKEYDIEKFIIDEKKLSFILKNEEWIKYTDKISTILKIEYAEYTED